MSFGSPSPPPPPPPPPAPPQQAAASVQQAGAAQRAAAAAASGAGFANTLLSGSGQGAPNPSTTGGKETLGGGS